MRRQREEISTLNSRLSHFSYVLSHNIKNPLTHITGASYLIKMHGENLNTEQLEQLNTIEHTARRIDRMLSNALNTKGHKYLCEADPAKEIRRIIASLKLAAAKKDISVEASIQEGTAIKVNLKSYIDVFQNITRELVSCCPAGSKLSISYYPEDGQQILKVRDYLPALLDNEREKVFTNGHFDPFTSSTSDFSENLYKAKKEIEEMGGSIRYEKMEDYGGSLLIEFNQYIV
ncbi:MAG: HAMP domain-containing sensor histidine kinase [Bacteroidota bacterium]